MGYKLRSVVRGDPKNRERPGFPRRNEIVPGVSCWLALQANEVVGFCWGYESKPQKLEDKLGVSFLGKLVSFHGDKMKIAYQDELGVVSSCRGQKIAKILFAQRHEDFLEQGLQFGIVRTRRAPEPSVTYQWFTDRLGYEVLAEYPGDDGRVILGRPLAGLKELL